MAMQKGLMRRNPGGRFTGLDELTDMQATFALAYARNGGNATAAAAEAGYTWPALVLVHG
jgi:hypothetical protein